MAREQRDPPGEARVHARGGATRFSFCSFFRGPCRALQDLYEDWSAIYRNRIPPRLVLPLLQQHPFLAVVRFSRFR